ncbi:hypothetical protein TWF730_004258 [Orbilia blumenaviensis]|uniref:Uncharacterized protein n=1 Tax=Orbilia blumenaviensis TaxID=1796055 RepID=A0AAV9U2B8_9PEZI
MESYLKSSTVKIWIEKLGSDGYTEAPIYSSCKTTEGTKGATYKSREAFIESSAGEAYRIRFRLSPHIREFAFQVIIDGIEQHFFMIRGPYRMLKSAEYPLPGRCTESEAYRAFQFTKLDVRDPGPGAGDYVFDESQHCSGGVMKKLEKDDPIRLATEHMVGKNSVGSIRINLYRLFSIEKVSPETLPEEYYKGCGDWKTCEAVDQIGALKLGAGVQHVTTLGARIRKARYKEWFHATRYGTHPFETFVFKYRPYNILKEDNLLVQSPNLSNLQKLSRFIKNIFTSSKKSKQLEKVPVLDEKAW